MGLNGAICGLSYEEGFLWDRDLVAGMTPEEVHELAALHRQQLVV